MILSITLNDFFLSILSSLVASFLFIFSILFFLRPRVKISKEICFKPIDIDGKANPVYHFKVVNLSLFPAYDIEAQLDKLSPYPVQNGMNFRVQSLMLTKDKLSFIAPYRPNWLKPNYGNYAMLFGTNEDIKEILAHPQSEIRFQITLKHGVTGLSKVYQVKYPLISSIKEGQYIFGNNLAII